MSKPSLAFQPTPRPRPLSTQQETEKLVEATHDLGFGRQTAAPQPVAKPAVTPVPAPSAEPKAGEAALRKPAALKFDVPDELWDDLRMAAIRRRVTVKYLVLEALEAKGYAVDLAGIPEDGRRLR
ncbi:hypothetical protein LJR225_004905 [Phenylobacterium sp. LjRoot225]|uniref:hypothetical protein n=1 Tax=Phenylobacterium sp. LjRoot225 TaxID=3342285 RepID=UPI003ED14112